MKTDDTWLNQWQHNSQAPAGAILELGCGDARDTRLLQQWRRLVVATDIRLAQLATNKTTMPRVSFLAVDHARPLPFTNAAFSTVLASLSLHYFTWAQTAAILAEIGRVLQPDGLLVGRVNATKDIHHGAVDHPLIEPGLYDVNGRSKRFFSDADVQAWLHGSWQILSLKEQTIDRYHKPKVVWEFSAKKRIAP